MPVLAGYSFLFWILLMQTISVWNSTNNYCNQLAKNFQPFLKYEKVFILDAPAYYNGLAAFRSALEERIYFEFGSPLEKINFISGSYHESSADSLVSIKVTDGSLVVKGPADRKQYFSIKGAWAKSYETDEYKVAFDSTGYSYTLTFKKEIPPNSVFIYASGDNWKKVN